MHVMGWCTAKNESGLLSRIFSQEAFAAGCRLNAQPEHILLLISPFARQFVVILT